MPSDSVDILENTIRRHDDLLDILLMDQTKRKQKHHNIIWATDSYRGYKPTSEMLPEHITGEYALLIQPRIAKSKEEQQHRTKEKAEVFTPDRIVDEMNKQIDWNGENWPVDSENWQNYVKEPKLEITCGEAPYLVSRYNAVTGEPIPIEKRVGLLDRKLRVVSKETSAIADWTEYAIRAVQSVYGYEFQGDNLFLARRNVFKTVEEFLTGKVPSKELKDFLIEVAEIISWNLWQMDGLTGSPPFQSNVNLFGGANCLIKDWKTGKVIEFISLTKGAAR